MKATATETREYPPEELLAWTPRQREVLALLAEGRTNAGIAEEPGISLDGAKWHVREVMSKLDVGSREEAADYWRWRNGLPTRLRTGRRRLAGLLLSRWAMGLAGAATLAAVGALVVFAVLVLVNRGDTEPTDAVDGTATVAPDGSASPAAETSTSPAAPSPTEAGVLTYIDGVPVHELTVADPVPLPAQTVFYYMDPCFACASRPLTLSRAWLGEDGSLVAEILIAPNDSRFPPGYPAHLMYDRAGRFAVAWCLTAEYGTCGTNRPTSEDVPTLLLVSLDGGVTWQDWGELPPRAYIFGFDGDNLRVGIGNPAEGEEDTYVWYPSGEAAPAPDLERVAEEALVTADGLDLTVRFGSDDPSAFLSFPPTTFLSFSKGDELASDYYAFPAGGVLIADALSPRLLLGNANRNSKAQLVEPVERTFEGAGLALQPVLVDLDARTISPIQGFVPEPPMNSGIQPLVAVQGPASRVTDAGDCLNVREEPSFNAALLDCYADGVILRDRGEQTDAGGETWLAVATPDGREGWASAAFLAPLFGDTAR